jgi:hypothetical protein
MNIFCRQLDIVLENEPASFANARGRIVCVLACGTTMDYPTRVVLMSFCLANRPA